MREYEKYKLQLKFKNVVNWKNISLRALETSDIDILYQWENNTDIWHVSNTLTPFSRYALEQYLISSHQDIYTNKQLRLIISDKTNKAVGCIDLFDFEPNHSRAGIGILIADKNDRRKGYASEALKLFIDYSFKTLHLNQLYCNITVDNTPSISLFESHNFKISGTKKEWVKNGKTWKDEHLLQLMNNVYQ